MKKIAFVFCSVFLIIGVKNALANVPASKSGEIKVTVYNNNFKAPLNFTAPQGTESFDNFHSFTLRAGESQTFSVIKNKTGFVEGCATSKYTLTESNMFFDIVNDSGRGLIHGFEVGTKIAYSWTPAMNAIYVCTAEYYSQHGNCE